jgi:hypothetical protein
LQEIDYKYDLDNTLVGMILRQVMEILDLCATDLQALNQTDTMALYQTDILTLCQIGQLVRYQIGLVWYQTDRWYQTKLLLDMKFLGKGSSQVLSTCHTFLYNLPLTGKDWDYAKAVEHGTLNIRPQPHQTYTQHLPPQTSPHYPPYQSLHRQVSPPPSYHPSYPGEPQRSSRFATLFEESQYFRDPQNVQMSRNRPPPYESPDDPNLEAPVNNVSKSYSDREKLLYERPSTSQLVGTPSDSLRTPSGLLRTTDTQTGRKVPPGGFCSRLW